MKILVLAAHPDDEVLGVGGTVIKLIQSGHQVFTIVVTEGATLRKNDLARHLECAKKANKLMGVTKFIPLNLRDQYLDTYPISEVIQKIEKYVVQIQPITVYTHFFGDLNRDHRLVYEATMVACRPTSSVKNIYAYETVSSTEWSGGAYGTFNPNYYEDISRTFTKKLDVLAAYTDTSSNEIKPFPHPRSYEGVRVLAEKRGSESNLSKAEGFMVIRQIQ